MSEEKTTRNQQVLRLHFEGRTVNEIVRWIIKHPDYDDIGPTRVRQIIQREQARKAPAQQLAGGSG